MAPRPSSPNSLLWAHQLKREHGYLLQRMQNLEIKHKTQDSRLEAAESAAAANPSSEIEGLAEQVKALSEAGIEKRVAAMEESVAEKVDNVQAESEAHTMQIDTLQKDAQEAEDERRKAAGKDRMLLKRIDEVEASLKKYEKSLGQIGKRPDETRFEQIRGQLSSLTKEVQQEGEQMKWLQDSIAALESANAELFKANEKLDREISKMAAKQAAGTQKKRAGEDSQATAGAEEDSAGKKKSHKWVGGGADRDVIRMGSGMFGKPKPVNKLAPSTSKQPQNREPPKKNPVPPGLQKKPPSTNSKPQRFVPSDPSGTPKKSHRWAGGGADKDIIQAGTSTGRKRRRSSDVPVEAAKKKAQRSSEDDDESDIVHVGSLSAPKSHSNYGGKRPEAPKPPRRSIPQAEGDEVIVRAGKGWIEVAEADGEPEEADPTPPVKRKRGRPRKEPITPHVTDEDATRARASRRGVPQSQHDDEEETEANRSIAEEILGELRYEVTAMNILAVEPSIPRFKLVHLKEILQRNQKARTDLNELLGELTREGPTRNAGAVNAVFTSDDEVEAGNHERIKKIKKEASPNSSSNALHRVPVVYTSLAVSELTGPTGNEAARNVSRPTPSRSSEAPRGPRRRILQPDDIVVSAR